MVVLLCIHEQLLFFMKKILLGLFILLGTLNALPSIAQISINDPFDFTIKPNDRFIELSKNLNVDLLAEWHNECMDDFFKKVEDGQINVKNESFTAEFNEIFSQFMKMKGLDAEGCLKNNIFSFSRLENVDFCKSELSHDAQEIGCKLENLINELSSGKYEVNELIGQVDILKNELEKIKDPNEVAVFKLTLGILKGSVIYWSQNFDRVLAILENNSKKQVAFNFVRKMENSLLGNVKLNNNNLLFNDISNNFIEHNSNNVSHVKTKSNLVIRWWLVACSDAMGAWRWGKVGLVAAGGPAGAFACGFAGACGHSLASMIVQSL